MNDQQRKFRRRADARPDEVLDAALAAFMEKGFAATRVEDIAKRAGVSKGTVYLYFPSKEALLEGLVRRAIVPVATSVIGTLSQADVNPRQAITVVLHALMDRMSNPNVLAIPKIVLREVVGFPHLAQMYRDEVLSRALPVMIELIEKGIAQGHFRPVDPELTVRTIIGPIIVHLMLAEVFSITPAKGLELDRLVDNHLSILFDGMAAPIEEPSP